MVISDKQFDSQFDKVANLVHYPWIGSGYASAPKRVLIMGHSHYTIDGKTILKTDMKQRYRTSQDIQEQEYNRLSTETTLHKTQRIAASKQSPEFLKLK